MKYHIEVIQSSRFCYINAISDETNERIGKVCIDLNSEDVTRYEKAYKGKFAKIILVSTSINACGCGVATTLLNKAIDILNDYNLYLNNVEFSDPGTEYISLIFKPPLILAIVFSS